MSYLFIIQIQGTRAANTHTHGVTLAFSAPTQLFEYVELFVTSKYFSDRHVIIAVPSASLTERIRNNKPNKWFEPGLVVNEQRKPGAEWTVCVNSRSQWE